MSVTTDLPAVCKIFVLTTESQLTTTTSAADTRDVFEYKYPIYVVILCYVITLLVGAVTLVTNALVIMTFYHYPDLRTPANYLIVSLAHTDILGGCFILPMVVDESLRGRWLFGEDLCYVWVTVSWSVWATLLYGIFLITLERFISIRFPIWYRIQRKEKPMLLIVLSNWIVPPSLFLVVVYTADKAFFLKVCEVYISLNLIQEAIIELFYFWLPFYWMSWVYLYMYRYDRHSAMMAARRAAKSKADGDSSQPSVLQVRKPLKILCSILGTFILCWIPMHSVLIANKLCGECVSEAVYQLTYALAFLNCPINPFLYAFINAKFQKSLKKMVRNYNLKTSVADLFVWC